LLQIFGVNNDKSAKNHFLKSLCRKAVLHKLSYEFLSEIAQNKQAVPAKRQALLVYFSSN
jgi:hypothetical protein